MATIPVESGDKFGDWTVLVPISEYPLKALCRCLCGKEKYVYRSALRNGTSTTCSSCSKTTHGHAKNESSTYTAWRSMITRCMNPNAANFSKYGAAGITVCDRWLKFENFIEDMGVKPDGKRISLDRVDGTRGYEKDNCRWADSKTQNQNRSSTKLSLEIVRLYKSGQITSLEVQSRYGVSRANMCAIASGRSWGYV